MLSRMEQGRFKVFNTCDWFEEYRLYHRKDGKIVKLRMTMSTRYAVMSLRHSTNRDI